MSKQIYSGVYIIFNLANGKVYVGQASNLKERYTNHWTNYGVNKNHNEHLSNAFKKHGVDSFVFVILNWIAIEFLDDYEQFYLDYFEAAKPEYGYNILDKAGTTRGASFYQDEKYKYNQKAGYTYEVRVKIKAAISGKNHYLWNKHPQEETRKKMSESAKNKSPMSQLSRDKLSKSLSGRVLSNLTRKRISENHADVSGENNPMYGRSINTKNYYFKSKDNRTYFITNMNKFCYSHNLTSTAMRAIPRGAKYNHSHKGWTGQYAEQWMIDKVKPLMKPGQYWVQIDEKGNII